VGPLRISSSSPSSRPQSPIPRFSLWILLRASELDRLTFPPALLQERKSPIRTYSPFRSRFKKKIPRPPNPVCGHLRESYPLSPTPPLFFETFTSWFPPLSMELKELTSRRFIPTFLLYWFLLGFFSAIPRWRCPFDGRSLLMITGLFVVSIPPRFLATKSRKRCTSLPFLRSRITFLFLPPENI